MKKKQCMIHIWSDDKDSVRWHGIMIEEIDYNYIYSTISSIEHTTVVSHDINSGLYHINFRFDNNAHGIVNSTIVVRSITNDTTDNKKFRLSCSLRMPLKDGIVGDEKIISECRNAAKKINIEHGCGDAYTELSYYTVQRPWGEKQGHVMIKSAYFSNCKKVYDYMDYIRDVINMIYT